MRILLENEVFKHQGGSETIALHTYEILKEYGHDVFFFATDKKDYYEKDYKYSKYFPKFVYNTKEFIKNPIAYFWNFEAEKKFREMIKEVKPDIIHLNLLISPSILKVCKEIKIPTVMTLHIPSPICPANNFYLKNKTLCNDFKCKNGNYWHCIFNSCKSKFPESNIRKAILSYIYNITKSYSAIDYIICPSDALKDFVMKTNIGINKEKLITIPNFLGKDEIKIIPNYQNKGYFLYVGRLEKVKGVQHLLEAVKNLPKEIEFHIVGTGAYEQTLKTYAEENNLNNVKFIGYKNREEIQKEYHDCISLIVPSDWFEIFGMINIEAFIHGKPVIASKIGGIPEIIENDKNGLLFTPGNVKEIQEHILKYWNNPEQVISHGKNAYNKAINEYNIEKYYHRLIKIYEEITNAK